MKKWFLAFIAAVAFAATTAQASQMCWTFNFGNDVDAFLADRLPNYNLSADTIVYIIYDGWSGGDYRDAVLAAVANGSFTPSLIPDIVIGYYSLDSFGVGDLIPGKNVIEDVPADWWGTMDVYGRPVPYIEYELFMLVINGDYPGGEFTWAVTDNQHGTGSNMGGIGWANNPKFDDSHWPVIPEPATGFLVLGGAATLLLRRRRGKE